MVKKFGLRSLIFMALCCDLGLFSKRLVSPMANLITDALHIPGGVATGFSLMFLTVAAAVIGRSGCATVMGGIQSVLALAFGMVGSMGAMAPMGYIVPGVVIDCVFALTRPLPMSDGDRAVLANGLASLSASLTANLIVFRLRGPILLLYCCVALTFGALFGLLGGHLTGRLGGILYPRDTKGGQRDENK